MRVLTTSLYFWLLTFQVAAVQTDYASNIVSLIDPAKLSTLSARRANPRVQKAVYWLVMARNEGQKPDIVPRPCGCDRRL